MSPSDLNNNIETVLLKRNVDPNVENVDNKSGENSNSTVPKTYKNQLVWRNIIAMAVLHGFALYAFVLIPTMKMYTLWFGYLILHLGSLGVQVGAHRLWAHRSYKANFGLRLFLSICHVMALQNDLYEWCRDHRGHHKWSDTDADPHNATRGFFFSHVGWLLVKKHPDVKRKGATLDLSDLKADPIVMFQRKFYIPMVLLFWFFIPSVIPVYFWGESWKHAIIGCVFMRWVFSVNLTWCVNSAAHIYGNRPYDTAIRPVEATMRHALMGEGFHNYHHSYPWDYSASELGAWDVFNPGTAMINFFHYMGWAWDLKKVNPDVIAKRSAITGNTTVQYKRGNGLNEWKEGAKTLSVPLVVPIAIYYIFNIPWMSLVNKINF